jgi:integrase
MTGHIRRRGKQSWEIKFDAGRDPASGKRVIRYHSFKGTKRDAERKLTELLGSIDSGSYVEPSKLTVGEHVRARVDQWEAAGAISPKTAERYRELVENQIVPHLGAKLMQKLKPLDIEAWHTTLKATGRKDGAGGVSARTIGHAHRVLKKALKEALRHDLVTRNAAAEQNAPKVEGEEMVILGNDDVKDLLGKLQDLVTSSIDSGGDAMLPAAITSLFTGLRRGELLALRWPNAGVDGAKVMKVCEALEETRTGGVRFKSPKTKNGRRDLTLPDVVAEALREHRRRQLELRLALGLGKLPDDALVFPALDGGPQSPRSFSKEWATLADALGFPQVTLQALRHTHASQLIDAGVDIVTISKRLGHASPNVTLQIYAHLFRRSDDKAAQAINAALAGPGAS